MNVEVAHHAHCQLGEGALWDARQQQLWWVDILGGKLHRLDPQTGHHAEFNVGQHVGTVGLRENGGLVVAVASGFAFFNPQTEQLTPLTDPESHLPNNRFNDGKPGPDGAFWAGTMAYDVTEGAGSLYRLAADGQTAVQQVANVTISNGLAWTADEQTLYYIDSIPHHVYRFTFDKESGQISNQQIAFTVPETLGTPDGMTIDEEGMLWIALHGGGAVTRWNPTTGTLLDTIALPTTNITCCTFGGSTLQTLYITSARDGLDAQTLAAEPLAGATFAVQTAVRGLPPYRYQA